MEWTTEHRDTNMDGIDDCVVVLSHDFSEPLIGDYRGVVMARVPYTPSNVESVQRAVEIADAIVSKVGS